ncbi:MAG: LEA14-like dessication related protein [Paracoccaceae bacterium]|jgi:LEA14-like dessication related protein
MKKFSVIIFISLLIGFTSGCSKKPESPYFIKLENVKVVSASLTKVVLSGDAVFNNPNALSCELTKTNIHIRVNDVDITDINQDISIALPRNSNFTLPVYFSFNPKQLSSENNGFLKNAIKSFLNKEITVEYQGDITVKVLGVHFDVPIAYSETVSLRLNNE